MKSIIVLTDEERLILESYKKTIDGLASYLGSAYEIILHSLESFDHSVIKIVNGFHPGRKEGSPITNLALEMYDKLDTDPNMQDHYVCFAKNKMGEPLKSMTMAIRGKNNRIIGLLCINLYLGTPMIHFFEEFTPHDSSVFAHENFSENSPALIYQELASIKEQVYNDESISPSARNKEIIRQLHKKNLFEIKNSVELVANELEISINTVYFHLRKISKQNGGIVS